MRILLVEDNPEQLEPLHEVLSEVGHIVDGVPDGETAQWLLEEKDYDLNGTKISGKAYQLSSLPLCSILMSGLLH